MSSDE
jgi:hypothetical protein